MVLWACGSETGADTSAGGGPATGGYVAATTGGSTSTTTAGGGSAPEEAVLTVDHTKIDEGLVDFPLLVHLGEASGVSGEDMSVVFDALETDDNRRKIFFTLPDGTPLYAEIESWSTSSKQAWLWLRVPTLSASEDTVIHLRFGAGMPDNTSHVGDTGSTPATEVWSNGFVAVHHLGQTATEAVGDYLDSTQQAIHATGGAGSPEATPGKRTGKIGDCPDFDGLDDFIEIPDHDGFSQPTTGALSISFWFTRDVLDYPGRDYIRMIGKGIAGQPGLDGPNNHEWTFNIYNDSLGEFPERRQRRSFYMCDYESGQCAGDYAQPGWEPFGPIPYYQVGSWTHYRGQADDTYVYAYNNGVLGHVAVDYRNYADNNITPNNENAPVRLGTRDNPGSSGILDGGIDEFRIAGTFRSDSWIRVDYASQTDELIDYTLRP